MTDEIKARVQVLFPKGQVATINGIPVEFEHSTVVNVHPNNVPLMFAEAKCGDAECEAAPVQAEQAMTIELERAFAVIDEHTKARNSALGLPACSESAERRGEPLPSGAEYLREEAAYHRVEALCAQYRAAGAGAPVLILTPDDMEAIACVAAMADRWERTGLLALCHDKAPMFARTIREALLRQG